MKNFRIDSRQLRSAMIFQANQDVRYYLNGLLIGDGKVVSTDGHRMIVVDSKQAKFSPKIFAIKGTIPASARESEFIYVGKNWGVVINRSAAGVELNQVLKFEIVEGRFPEYHRVIPQGKPQSIKEAGFNIRYLYEVHKAALALGKQFECGKFQFYGENKATTIEITTPENHALCVIMAARL